MNFPFLILFCIIWPSLSCLNAQTSSSSTEEILLTNSTRKSPHQEIHYQKKQERRHHHHHHHHQVNHNETLKTEVTELMEQGHGSTQICLVHGTVNIIGWGVLLPIGAIIARYFREVSNDWYALHILSHLSGFLLGTLGWGLGISIKNEAKEHTMSTHGIIGTIIFAFAALQPNEEHERRKYWVIYHNVVGYALIVLIIANIFQGINNQNAAKKWEWIYGVTLGVLAVIALALEVLRWRYAL